MVRWCMPVELSRDRLKTIVEQCQRAGFLDQFEVEVHSYGHLPLAYSARCFTARSGKSLKGRVSILLHQLSQW